MQRILIEDETSCIDDEDKSPMKTLPVLGYHEENVLVSNKGQVVVARSGKKSPKTASSALVMASTFDKSCKKYTSISFTKSHIVKTLRP